MAAEHMASKEISVHMTLDRLIW